MCDPAEIYLPKYSFREVTRMIGKSHARLVRQIRRLRSELASAIAPKGSVAEAIYTELAKPRKRGTDV